MIMHNPYMVLSAFWIRLNITNNPETTGNELHIIPMRRKNFLLDTLTALLGTVSSSWGNFSLLSFGRASTCSTVLIDHPSTKLLVIHIVSPLPILFTYIGYSLDISSCLLSLNISSIY